MRKYGQQYQRSGEEGKQISIFPGDGEKEYGRQLECEDAAHYQAAPIPQAPCLCCGENDEEYSQPWSPEYGSIFQGKIVPRHKNSMRKEFAKLYG